MDRNGGLTRVGHAATAAHAEVERAPGQIWITTAKSALVLQVGEDGRLSQLHYGAVAAELPLHYSSGTAEPALPKKPLDFYPAAGDGWVLEPALRVTHADGNTSTDLTFDGKSVTELDENVTLTRIVLVDPAYPLTVTLNFKAYQAEDVIEHWTEIEHREPEAVTLHNFASSAPLLDSGSYWLTQFHGEWADEANVCEEKLNFGIKVLDSKLGSRAHEYRNPSFFLAKGGPALENSGEVIAGTLAWSGSFQFAFEVDYTGRLRALCGMNPYASQYRLEPAETFATPAMLWSWSGNGKGEVSRHLHRWARKYGVRDGSTLRDILLNNWEATYFDFDEKKLVSLFDGAKALGMDLFLLDDGWFGNAHARNDDTTGLGDWDVNVKKLPQGISYLASEAEKRGLRFGIWVEPEMVNPVSELFEKHPDWVVQQPKRDLKLVRHQLVLDLTRPEVREFSFSILDDLLTQNPGISYVKWDCNRIVNQPGSTYLKPEEQTHLWIEYTRALYDIMERITRKHPNVQWMLCAGGGGRVDYGSLRFGHEFWPSDNTNPDKRIFIQWGHSQFFPAISICSHVTRSGDKPLKFAFDVAMSGRLGMDIDVERLTDDEKKFTASAIATYKTIRDVVQLGDLYRLESPYEGDRTSLLYVTEDRRRAVLFVYQTKDSEGRTHGAITLQGLDAERRYRIQELNLPLGAKSELSLGGQTLNGGSLMYGGVVPPVRGKDASAVIEFTDTSL
jgi:alpha-galactosidase